MRIVPVMAVGLGMLAAPQLASASLVVVDRGLPVANLNRPPGASRSNVAWAVDPPPNSYGDTFTLSGGAGAVYAIDTIRTWVVSTAANATALTTLFGTGVTLFTGIGSTLSTTATS